MTNSKVMLNEMESKVLRACIEQVEYATGNQFGYMDDVNKCGLSKHEFAGYISSLCKKGLITEGDPEFQQFMMKDAAFEFLPEYDVNKFETM